jgi:hypothetical protein
MALYFGLAGMLASLVLVIGFAYRGWTILLLDASGKLSRYRDRAGVVVRVVLSWIRHTSQAHS